MTMQVTNHMLDGIRWAPAADRGGPLLKPRVIVLHYTGGQSFVGAERTLTTKDDRYVSAHLIVGRAGEVVQTVAFDRQAYHAGESSWHGLKRLNSSSIGIEIVNPGWKRPGFPGWPTKRMAHKHGGSFRDWYLYTDAQYQACAEVCLAIMDHYQSISDVVGHDDIAPGRKSDPGPAWDWAKFRSLLAQGA